MLPVIVPPQADGPLNLGQFKPNWYLFFQAAQASISAAGGIIQFGTSAMRKAFPTQGLINGTLWIETDSNSIYQWQVVGSSMSWVPVVRPIQILDLTLAASSTTVNAPAGGALELIVILRQDSSGGRGILWGTGFSGASVNLDTTALTLSTFLFALSGGLYVMIGQPSTGMTP